MLVLNQLKKNCPTIVAFTDPNISKFSPTLGNFHDADFTLHPLLRARLQWFFKTYSFFDHYLRFNGLIFLFLFNLEPLKYIETINRRVFFFADSQGFLINDPTTAPLRLTD